MADKPQKKEQTMRYSDEELSLIKSAFADNQELLFAVRKHFLQMPLDAIDQDLLKVFKESAPLMKLMRKSYLPELEADAPINQEVDLWMTIDIKDKLPQQAWPLICSRADLITYLDEQLRRLAGEDIKPTITFESLSQIKSDNPDSTYVNLLTRNTIIQHNEMQLFQMKVLGGMKNETVEQTKERLSKDSNK